MWKTIPGYPDYDITEYGEIRDNRNDRILPQFNDKDGYKLANLYSKSTRVHRLVARTYIDNPHNYPVVNHKDFCKTNNYVENLEWCTHSWNSKHSYTNSHRADSVKEWAKQIQPLAAEASKTKVCQYDLQSNLLAIFDSQKEASERTGTCRSSITGCVTGKRKTAGGYKWSYLESSTTKCKENPTLPVRDFRKEEDIV